MTDSERPLPSALPRWWLALLSSFVAALCLWAADKLPWSDDWTLFAVMTTGLGIVHLGCALTALVGSPLRAKAWRVQGVGAMVYLAYVTWNLVRTSNYVAELYGGLGKGVAVSLGLVWLIFISYVYLERG